MGLAAAPFVKLQQTRRAHKYIAHSARTEAGKDSASRANSFASQSSNELSRAANIKADRARSCVGRL